jgi:hypothetical protein
MAKNTSDLQKANSITTSKIVQIALIYDLKRFSIEIKTKEQGEKKMKKMEGRSSRWTII